MAKIKWTWRWCGPANNWNWRVPGIIIKGLVQVSLCVFFCPFAAAPTKFDRGPRPRNCHEVLLLRGIDVWQHVEEQPCPIVVGGVWVLKSNLELLKGKLTELHGDFEMHFIILVGDSQVTLRVSQKAIIQWCLVILNEIERDGSYDYYTNIYSRNNRARPTL